MLTLRSIFILFMLLSHNALTAVDRDRPPEYILSPPDRQQEMSDVLDVGDWIWSYWSGSYLVTHNLKASPDIPVVALFDSQGARVRTGIVWFSSASSVSVKGVSVDAGGKIFVSGGT